MKLESSGPVRKVSTTGLLRVPGVLRCLLDGRPRVRRRRFVVGDAVGRGRRPRRWPWSPARSSGVGCLRRTSRRCAIRATSCPNWRARRPLRGPRRPPPGLGGRAGQRVDPEELRAAGDGRAPSICSATTPSRCGTRSRKPCSAPATTSAHDPSTTRMPGGGSSSRAMSMRCSPQTGSPASWTRPRSRLG